MWTRYFNKGKQKPVLGSYIDWSNPKTKGLIFCTIANEGTGKTLNDLTGNGHNATLNSAPTGTWVGGEKGHAVNLLGTSTTGGSIPDHDDLSPSEMTMLSWVNRDTNNAAEEHIASKHYQRQYGVYNNKLYYLAYNSWGGWPAGMISSTSTLDAGNWYQCIASYDGTNGKIYVNGELETSTAKNAMSTNFINNMGWGCYDGNNYYFNGQIDCIMMWNRALSDQEIKQLYEDPYCFIKNPLEMSFLEALGATFVSATNVLKYHTLGYANNLLNLKYHILSLVSSNTILKYSIREFVSKTSGLLYNVNNFVSQTSNLLYNLRGFVNNTSILKYDVRGFVNNTVNLLYSISTALSLVANSVIVKYNINNYVNSGTIIKYDIRDFVNSTKNLLYDIRGYVSNQRVIKYNLFNFVSKTSNLLYNLSEVVSTILGYPFYNMIGTGTKYNQTIKYNRIPYLISQLKTLRYHIALYSVEKSVALIYNIRNYIGQTTVLRYNIGFVKELVLRAHITLERVLRAPTSLVRTIRAKLEG